MRFKQFGVTASFVPYLSDSAGGFELLSGIWRGASAG